MGIFPNAHWGKPFLSFNYPIIIRAFDNPKMLIIKSRFFEKKRKKGKKVHKSQGIRQKRQKKGKKSAQSIRQKAKKREHRSQNISIDDFRFVIFYMFSGRFVTFVARKSAFIGVYLRLIS